MYYQSQNYYLVPLTASEMERLRTIREEKPVEDMELRDEKKNTDLYDPEEALKRGNIFKKEYRGYKDYKPGLKMPSDERSRKLLEIMIYGNAAHDILLKLDVFPGDKELIAKFNEYTLKTNESMKEFQAKFGPLTPSAAISPKDGFAWINTPSAWVK